MTFYAPDAHDGCWGVPVSGGDVNNDGFADVVVSAFGGDGPPGSPIPESGEVSVWLSDGQVAGVVDFAKPSPRVRTIYFDQPYSYLGVHNLLRDLDGDGCADVIAGAFGASPLGRVRAGEVVVVFGAPIYRTGPYLVSDPHPDMTRVLGQEEDDRLGAWSDVGDVDGDGILDLVMGADRADGEGNAKPEAGEVIVLYGPIPRGATIDLADSTLRVTRIYGVDADDHFGSTLCVLDLDGDGVSDVAASSASANLARSVFDQGGAADGPPGQPRRVDCGEIWIVYGRPGLPRDFVLDPDARTGCQVIYGRSFSGRFGEEMNRADVNGDGMDDLLAGALTEPGPIGQYRPNAGAGYVFFGNEALHVDSLATGPAWDMALPPSQGWSVVYGLARSLFSDTFSAGDVNADGFDDLLIGAPHDRGPLGREAGTIYVVFGEADFPATIDLETTTRPFLTVEGAEPDDDTAYWGGAADLDGDGFAEVLVNAMSGAGPRNARPVAGDAYAVSGRWLTLHPSSPRLLRAESAPDERSAVLEWETPEDGPPAAYRVLYSPFPDLHRAGAPAYATETFPGSATGGMIARLRQGARYHVAVCAIAPDGSESRLSNELSLYLGQPVTLPAPEIVDGSGVLEVSWAPSGNPGVLGYNVYCNTTGEPPAPSDRVNAGLVAGRTFTYSGAPDYVWHYFYVTEVDSFYREGDPSEAAIGYPHPPVAEDGILLVNAIRWQGNSNGPGGGYAGDPYEMYASLAITGSHAFDFWDIDTEWSAYPPGHVPVGNGELEPGEVFGHALVVWVGRHDGGHSHELEDATPVLLEYLHAGGRMILASRALGGYLNPELVEEGRIERWTGIGTVTAGGRIAPAWPGLVEMGPGNGAAVSYDAERFTLPDSQATYPLFTYGPLGDPVGLVAEVDSSGRRLVLLSFDLPTLNLQAVRTNMEFLFTGILDYEGLGIRDPDGSVRPRVSIRVWPNPTRSSSTIALALTGRLPAAVEVFDTAGRRVRRFDLEPSSPGNHEIVWDGRDAGGRLVASGLYLVRASAGGARGTARILLAR